MFVFISANIETADIFGGDLLLPATFHSRSRCANDLLRKRGDSRVMMQRALRLCCRCWCVVVSLTMATSACAEPFFSPRDIEPRGPKALLEWSNKSDEEEEEGEADVFGDRIITDRPHVAEAASLVGLGRAQIETGYTYFLDRNAGTKVQTHSFPEPLLRVGLFREWFEFRFAYNYLVEQTNDFNGRTRLSGSDDIYVGAKVALAEQSGIFPELTVFPQMRVPTGSRAFTAGQVLPGMNFAYAWEITKRLELECNTQVNRRRDDDIDHFYVQILQTINFEYTLHQKLMVFNEFILLSPCGANVALPEYYYHNGAQFFLTNNFQLDVHAAVGLNRNAANFFGGTGLCWRY